MKKYLLVWVAGLALFNLVAMAQPSSPSSANFYTQRVKQTCQCQYCNLRKANLGGFKPGSVSAQENPFAKSPVGQSKAQVSQCWLKCNLTGADMGHANLSNTNFTICLRGQMTPIAAAEFQNANLNHANLSNAKFYGADFSYANLSYANLSKADLSLSDFSNANFSRADLSNARSRMDAMHGWGSNFSQADFSNAKLNKARLYGLFTGANFSNAILKGTTLITSPDVVPQDKQKGDLWRGVNFSNANLTGAKILVANVKRAQPITQSKAIFCHTIMPSGKVNNRDCGKSK